MSCRPKKVYVAGPWADREVARGVAAQLVAKGHSITHNWWDHDVPGEEEAQLVICARNDFEAVKCADVFLLLNSQKRGEETSGKAVELGFAIYGRLFQGQPERIIGTGIRGTNIFQLLPEVEWFCKVEDAIDVI